MTCEQKLLGYNRFTLVSSLTLITQDFELFITIQMINGRRGIFSLSSPDRDPSHRVGPWGVPEIHLTGWVHGLFQRSISQGGSMDCSRDPSHRVGLWSAPEIHLTGWVHGLFQRSISQNGSMGSSRDPSTRVGPWAVPEIHLTGWVHGLFQRSTSHGSSMGWSREPSHRVSSWTVPEIRDLYYETIINNLIYI